MSSVQIKRVETKKDLKDFIEFHYDLYEGNQYDAPNLYSDGFGEYELVGGMELILSGCTNG